MSLQVFAFRPEPGLSQTLVRARQMGLEVIGCPLFEIRPVPWRPPEAGAFDALLVGSANVFRHGGEGLTALNTLPVHAVGETTAELARMSGFDVASVGQGGLDTVVRALPDTSQRLLRLSGRERVDLTPRGNIEVTERIVYEAAPLPLSSSCAKTLREGGIAMLHSAAAARQFASECGSHNLPRDRIAIAALGPRIAETAGACWRSVRSAPMPEDGALLALVREMWQDLRGGSAA